MWFSGAGMGVGVSRRVHPRKLTWSLKRMIWKLSLSLWGFLVSMLVFGSVQLGIRKSHGSFQAPPRLAGQLSYSISSAGFGLASDLVGCERAKGKVAWCSANGEGRFKHGKPIFIRLSQSIWQNKSLELGIFYLNLGCEHQQTWFSPLRMLCKCLSCLSWPGVSAIFCWKQLKFVNKLGAKGSTLLNCICSLRSVMCPNLWVELNNHNVSITCVHTPPVAVTTGITTFCRESLQTFICNGGGGCKEWHNIAPEFLDLYLALIGRIWCVALYLERCTLSTCVMSSHQNGTCSKWLTPKKSMIGIL